MRHLLLYRHTEARQITKRTMVSRKKRGKSIMLNDILKERQASFEANGSYNQDAIPEVYTAYKSYINTGKYPYNRQIVDAIKAQTPIDDNLLRYLGTEVYLASQQYKREQDSEYKVKMEQEGYSPLTTEAVKQLPKGSRIKVKASRDIDLFTANLDAEYKTCVNYNGIAFIMKPRASVKGLAVSSLSNAYYKLSNREEVKV